MSISQVTAPETPNSKIHTHSDSDPSLYLTEKLSGKTPQESVSKEPLFSPITKFDLFPEKEASLKNSLNELKSSLNSLISSADFFTNSLSSLKRSSDWKLSETNKIKDESVVTFQEGLNPRFFELQHEENNFSETKKSSMMSPLRESDLKNSKEFSSGIVAKSIEKPPGTPLSDMFGSSDKPSSNFNKAFLTLDELRQNSGRDLFGKTRGRDSPFFGSENSSLMKSWIEQGGIGFIPVIVNGKNIFNLDQSQEFKIGDTLMSEILLSAGSSKGGFQVFMAEESAIDAGLAARNKLNKLLKVGVSGSAVPLTKNSALYSLVTPIEVLPLHHYLSPKLNK